MTKRKKIFIGLGTLSIFAFGAMAVTSCGVDSLTGSTASKSVSSQMHDLGFKKVSSEEREKIIDAAFHQWYGNDGAKRDYNMSKALAFKFDIAVQNSGITVKQIATEFIGNVYTKRGSIRFEVIKDHAILYKALQNEMPIKIHNYNITKGQVIEISNLFEEQSSLNPEIKRRQVIIRKLKGDERKKAVVEFNKWKQQAEKILNAKNDSIKITFLDENLLAANVSQPNIKYPFSYDVNVSKEKNIFKLWEFSKK